ERERAGHQRAGIALPYDDIAADFAIQRLTGVPGQRRLWIEGVDVADAAAHEQRDDRGRTRLEVRRLRRVRVDAARFAFARCRVQEVVGQQVVLIQQAGEREAADSASRAEQELTPRPAGLAGVHR